MARKTPLAFLALGLLAIVIAVGAAIAPAGTASHGKSLTGTWVFTVNLPPPRPPLTSLQFFTRDGSFSEYANDASGAARSPAYGSWKRVKGAYAATGTFFRFNPQTGAHIGSTKVNRTIRVSADGNTATVEGQAMILDVSGNVVMSFPATGTGVRMQVERTPDLP